jgi:hypothetical protein
MNNKSKTAAACLALAFLIFAPMAVCKVADDFKAKTQGTQDAKTEAIEAAQGK